MFRTSATLVIVLSKQTKHLPVYVFPVYTSALLLTQFPVFPYDQPIIRGLANEITANFTSRLLSSSIIAFGLTH